MAVNLKTIAPGAAPLASDINQFVYGLAGFADLGALNLAGQINGPTAPTVASAGGGGYVNGLCYYRLVALTGWKDTYYNLYVSGFATGAATSLSGSNMIVNVTVPGFSLPIIGYAIYRTAAGGASGTEKFVGVSTNPLGATFVDNVADGSLGTGMPSGTAWPGTSLPASIPTTNTTGTTLYFNSVYQQAVINGNFDIWQRTTSTNGVNSVYVADRWWIQCDGTMTNTISRQVFPVGQTDVPNNPTYFHRSALNSASGQSNNYMSTCIENVKNFAGMNCTVSFWAKADAARSIGVTLRQNFGTGGSAAVVLPTQNVTAATSWQKFSVTFALPSIAGKTVGTEGTHYLYLMISFPINTVCIMDIAQVQLNVGTTALPFMPKTFAQELQDCQRYYEKSYTIASPPGSAVAGNCFQSYVTSGDLTMCYAPIVYFKVPKNKVPTVTPYSIDGTANAVRNASAATSPAAIVNGVDTNSFAVKTSAGQTANQTIQYQWVADAEF